MYCPKCGTENPDGTQLCSSCRWVLTSTLITTESPNVKTIGFAIASLVLGILSFCTFLLTSIPREHIYHLRVNTELVYRIFFTSIIVTAIPAIICSTIALLKIEKSTGQLRIRGIAIVGIALPGASLLIAAFLIWALWPFWQFL